MVQQQVRPPATVPAHSVPRMETLRVPPVAPPTNHGRTSAAWTTTFIVLIGSTIAALAVVFAVVWAFWVGLAVAVAGVVVGKVMQLLGHGQGGVHTQARGHGAH
jgi:lysylphosphatidylglycerol synthetase-like protein (DUF2156 family)